MLRCMMTTCDIITGDTLSDMNVRLNKTQNLTPQWMHTEKLKVNCEMNQNCFILVMFPKSISRASEVLPMMIGL